MFKIKKIKQRAVALLFCLMMCFVLTAPAFATELTDEQKANLDAQVEKLKAREAEIAETENTLAEVNAQIDEIDATIAALDERMAATQEELDALKAQYQQQLDDLEERLRVMYMYGDDGYVEMLFSSQDFADLLTRIDMIRNVMKSDRDAINAVRKTEKEIEANIEDLEKDKANANELKAQQELLKTNYESLLAAQELEYANEKALSDQLAKELGYVGIDAYINQIEWPFDKSLDYAFRISSWFGGRSSPGGIGSTDHQGWDIIPGDGIEILACASGQVVLAEYYGGYGNCVVIEHGQNNAGQTLHTLYGHMSTIYVSNGETVVQGQAIGVIGSTGNSTGTHLHLEIWEDKVPVDPWNYFARYQDVIYHY